MRRSNSLHVRRALGGRMARVVCGVFTFILAAGLFPAWAVAQRADGTFNLGPQVGQPAGLSVKVYRSPQTAYTSLFTTDGDDFASLRFHRLQERPLPDSLVYVYVGPGLFIGGKALDEDLPVAELGISGQTGLNFFAERFEVFVHVTPTVRLLPDLSFELGGSVGLRYVLWRP